MKKILFIVVAAILLVSCSTNSNTNVQNRRSPLWMMSLKAVMNTTQKDILEK